jgi:hypothetical protein
LCPLPPRPRVCARVMSLPTCWKTQGALPLESPPAFFEKKAGRKSFNGCCASWVLTHPPVKGEASKASGGYSLCRNPLTYQYFEPIY